MNNEQRGYKSDDEVYSQRFGAGLIEFAKEHTAIVRFEHGLEECALSDLALRASPSQAIEATSWDAPLEVITRAQAESIRSVNNSWSVFSRSRIALLPHQLWVCRRVLERQPIRWLIADDVGLGKTIEAGLILWPLISNGTAKRILILCPASLVPQWQERLREMFDLRFSMYAPEVDTPKSDFWNTHDQVIASLQTMRLDQAQRQQRLLDSESWDLLLVDEAHHLNADERDGTTLGYRLVERLVDEGKVPSRIFFTGTPHRGKDYGFWSLLRLLRDDLFDPGMSTADQLPALRDVMIRNNKQSVTDIQGRRLFKPLSVTMESYRYSDAESEFYRMLTEFIATGKAYASNLSAQHQRTVILVLIAMQKIASSSVAAIRRALNGRLSRIRAERESLDNSNKGEAGLGRTSPFGQYETLRLDDDLDELNRLVEEQISQVSVELMRGEEERLEELIEAAESIQQETKISRILELIEERYEGEPVLLFTEYKATQSLVISELNKRYGDGCATFINGDGKATDVINSSGNFVTLSEDRQRAAERFTRGSVRFLVSTEAGGEGIDLQDRCHVLFHVDLPWNPMRLHQRVGRLNRYGQSHQVEVVGLRNPDTVESLIWEKLEAKLDSIMAAFGAAMEDPEDLKQLVIGMTSPSLFTELFTEAGLQDRESLDSWFDEKTARFGGEDAVETVRNLVGHAASFDFGEVSPLIPRVDLQDLLPFFRSAVSLNGRLIKSNENGISFRTPHIWSGQTGIRDSYDGLVFDREYAGPDANQRILGVGHPLVNKAIEWATRLEARVSSLPRRVIARPVAVYRVVDSVTASGNVATSVVVGCRFDNDGEDPVLLRDWELLLELNAISEKPGIRRPSSSLPAGNMNDARSALADGETFVQAQLRNLDLSYQFPHVTPVALLWPSDADDLS
jgi:superfamily II DNA or RNA helicase